MYPCCKYTLLWVSSMPSIAHPIPFLPHPQFSTAVNIYPHIFYLHRYYVLWHCWCSIILFYFPSFSEFHRAVSLLQTCSTYTFVYDHSCFCVYVYLLDLSSTYERKHVTIFFWTLFTSLNVVSSNCIHLPSNRMLSFFLIAE
jgi:hypothetical protein